MRSWISRLVLLISFQDILSALLSLSNQEKIFSISFHPFDIIQLILISIIISQSLFLHADHFQEWTQNV